jgi:hypothetical protein
MKVTLKTLQESYRQLGLLCAQEIPKGQGKIAYKLGRIKADIDKEIRGFTTEIERICKQYGWKLGAKGEVSWIDENREDKIKPEDIELFNKEINQIGEDTFANEPFLERAVPFTLEELDSVFTLTGEMCAALGWLIVDKAEAGQDAKNAMADDSEAKKAAASGD